MAGIGPGAADLVTPRARLAIEQAEIVIGYRTYLDLVADFLKPGQKVLSSSMMQEIDRCRKALELAESGNRVTMVCGGDPGIYAMAALVFELARRNGCSPPIEIVPGVAALNSCAAVLGAPLTHDFASISLSDLLTPWEIIEKRLHAAAQADFVIVLYNPRSKKRTSQIMRAREIILGYRPGETPVGMVSSASRTDESMRLSTLEDMPDEDINMRTTVIVGNSSTFTWQNRMITPRGYRDKYGLE